MFKVGDRVVVTKSIEDYEFVMGKEAVIVGISGDGYEFPIELKFDDKDSFNFPELFKEDELELLEKQTLLKEQFIEKCNEVIVPQVLSIAVQLPSGAIEVITNTQDTLTKVSYYKDMYDEEFRLKHNKAIRIVGFMVV
jgi:hypothetical protein